MAWAEGDVNPHGQTVMAITRACVVLPVH